MEVDLKCIYYGTSSCCSKRKRKFLTKMLFCALINVALYSESKLLSITVESFAEI